MNYILVCIFWLFFIPYTYETQSPIEIKPAYKNDTIQSKFYITNSYVNDNIKRAPEFDKEAMLELKNSLTKKIEQLHNKEGRIIELEKQIEKLQMRKDLNNICGIKNSETKTGDEQVLLGISNQITEFRKQMSSVSIKEHATQLTKEFGAINQKLEAIVMKQNQIIDIMNETNHFLREYTLENKKNYQARVGPIIYAVNAGGDAHIDANGIYFKKDPLEGPGIASQDYLAGVKIKRSHEDDYVLYRTFRGGTMPFYYKIPVMEDGNYVAVLRFAEGYQRAPHKRVFNVLLNNKHIAIENLDIYAKATFGVVYEEYITFSVANANVIYKGEKSPIIKNAITIDFVKSNLDIPDRFAFVQVIYVVKGNIDNVPKLPPIYHAQS